MHAFAVPKQKLKFKSDFLNIIAKGICKKNTSFVVGVTAVDGKSGSFFIFEDFCGIKAVFALF